MRPKRLTIFSGLFLELWLTSFLNIVLFWTFDFFWVSEVFSENCSFLEGLASLFSISFLSDSFVFWDFSLMTLILFSLLKYFAFDKHWKLSVLAKGWTILFCLRFWKAIIARPIMIIQKQIYPGIQTMLKKKMIQ